VLEVHGTDPGSKNDIPNYCEKHGYQFLGYEDHPENYTRYLIQIE
jgi:tRNA 2-thiouridine synthesizing protein A